MREGRWVGQCRWTLVVKGFANSCGGAYSWKNPKIHWGSGLSRQRWKIYLRAGSWHSRPLDIVQKNWAKALTSSPCWRRAHSPRWWASLSWEFAGGRIKRLILLGLMWRIRNVKVSRKEPKCRVSETNIYLSTSSGGVHGVNRLETTPTSGRERCLQR